MPEPMNLFDISGRAMAAQMVRLNTTASNLANARSVSGTEADAFRAIKPVFRTITSGDDMATVAVDRVVQSDTAPARRHDPAHPLADAEGYVWDAGVDEATEMVEMIDAARAYQNNVQVLQTAKSLLLETLKLGQ